LQAKFRTYPILPLIDVWVRQLIIQRLDVLTYRKQ
jgi:hypothetical protein